MVKYNLKDRMFVLFYSKRDGKQKHINLGNRSKKRVGSHSVYVNHFRGDKYYSNKKGFGVSGSLKFFNKIFI